MEIYGKTVSYRNNPYGSLKNVKKHEVKKTTNQDPLLDRQTILADLEQHLFFNKPFDWYKAQPVTPLHGFRSISQESTLNWRPIELSPDEIDHFFKLYMHSEVSISPLLKFIRSDFFLDEDFVTQAMILFKNKPNHASAIFNFSIKTNYPFISSPSSDSVDSTTSKEATSSSDSESDGQQRYNYRRKKIIKSPDNITGLQRAEYRTRIFKKVFDSDPHYYFDQHIPKTHFIRFNPIVSKEELIELYESKKQPIPKRQLFSSPPSSPINSIIHFIQSCIE